MAQTQYYLPIDNNFIETKKVTQKTEQGENKQKERFLKHTKRRDKMDITELKWGAKMTQTVGSEKSEKNTRFQMGTVTTYVRVVVLVSVVSTAPFGIQLEDP